MNGRLLSKIKQAFPTIEEVSITLLIEAYQVALTDKCYDLTWDEEQFSVYLVSRMKKSKLRINYQLVIGIEKKLIDYDKLPIDRNNPKKIPRIDISIVSWSFKEYEEQEYFFEAKNLYETNILTKEASKYINRYIDTGIENFRIGKYYNGSLIGYVLHGDTEMIVAELNIKLKKNRISYESANSISLIEKIDCVNSSPYCYSSKHYTDLKKEIDIKHIFLKF